MRTYPELIMTDLGIDDVVVELHEHFGTHSEAPVEFRQVEGRPRRH